MNSMSDDLLIKFLLQETSPEEELFINKWIAADAANQKHFSQVELIWNSSKKLALTNTVNVDQAWVRFQEKAVVPKLKKPIIKPFHLQYSWLRIAAVLCIIAAGWAVYSMVFRLGETILIAQKEVLKEVLPDGSEVTLNKNSILSYPKVFTGSQRKIHLTKGDVFFNVKPDQIKPFVIEIDQVKVLVVGTAFNVKHLKNDIEVIVETGVVKVSRGSQQVTLYPGEKLLIKGAAGNLVRQENTDQLYNYYRTKMLVADSTPLWRVVEVLNEAYDVTIMIENPKLKNLTLTTTFKDEKLENILQVLADTFKLEVVHQGNRIILK